MIKKKFKVNEIEELLYGDSDSLNNISDSIIDSDHWYIQHEIIFQEKSPKNITLFIMMSQLQMGKVGL
jgi:hypothetical protein